MATEKLKFKLELYATMWDKPPVAEILINEKSFVKKEITGTEDKPDSIEFEHDLEENKEYNLIIKRSGKGSNQTLINEKGDILKDQLLNIKKIEEERVRPREGTEVMDVPSGRCREGIRQGIWLNGR